MVIQHQLHKAWGIECFFSQRNSELPACDFWVRDTVTHPSFLPQQHQLSSQYMEVVKIDLAD
jgi:hypothetical protein